MILMVDDERTEAYIEVLKESGFDLSFQTDVDAALKFFDENQDKINLLILDIRMATGTSFDPEESQNGWATGILFYERVRQIAPSLPVLMLTVRAKESMGDRFDGDESCWFCQKQSVLPSDLVQKVKDALYCSMMASGGYYGC